MSYTNGTTHYNLPLTTGADKRDWSDTNQAFSDVDAALYGAVQDTAQAELDIDALETRMDTAEQNISTNTGNIAGLDTRLTTAEGAITAQGAQITDTRQDLEDMICAYNEASATSTHAYAIGDYFIYNDVLYKAMQAIAIGDTIVPDTNCATTNVSTELLSLDNSNFVNTDVVCLFIETSTTAAHNYSIGEYFILNNVLYIVTAAITAGDTLTVGTNCNATSVTNELVNAMQHTKFTLLYEMDASTASAAWAGGQVSLSDDWTKFDCIAVKIKELHDRDAGYIKFIHDLNTINSDCSIDTVSSNSTGLYIQGRNIFAVQNDNYKLEFGGGYSITGFSTTSPNNNVAFPVKIYGVKF